MADMIQLLIMIEGQGWRAVAEFYDAAFCEGVAKLIRWGWKLWAECKATTGA